MSGANCSSCNWSITVQIVVCSRVWWHSGEDLRECSNQGSRDTSNIEPRMDPTHVAWENGQSIENIVYVNYLCSKASLCEEVAINIALGSSSCSLRAISVVPRNPHKRKRTQFSTEYSRPRKRYLTRSIVDQLEWTLG